MSGLIKGMDTSDNEFVVKVSDDGNKLGLQHVTNEDGTEDAAVPSDGAIIMVEARSTQKTAVDSGDAVIPVANLNGELALAGYDWTNGYHDVAEQNPISADYDPVEHANVTNGVDATYPYEITMDGYKWLGIQLKLSNGSGTCTVKIYGKMHTDSDYVDISSLYGAASWTGTGSPHILTDTFRAGQFHKIKIEVVASTGGSNDADWQVSSKKLY